MSKQKMNNYRVRLTGVQDYKMTAINDQNRQFQIPHSAVRWTNAGTTSLKTHFKVGDYAIVSAPSQGDLVRVDSCVHEKNVRMVRGVVSGMETGQSYGFVTIRDDENGKKYKMNGRKTLFGLSSLGPRGYRWGPLLRLDGQGSRTSNKLPLDRVFRQDAQVMVYVVPQTPEIHCNTTDLYCYAIFLRDETAYPTSLQFLHTKVLPLGTPAGADGKFTLAPMGTQMIYVANLPTTSPSPPERTPPPPGLGKSDQQTKTESSVSSTKSESPDTAILRFACSGIILSKFCAERTKAFEPSPWKQKSVKFDQPATMEKFVVVGWVDVKKTAAYLFSTEFGHAILFLSDFAAMASPGIHELVVPGAWLLVDAVPISTKVLEPIQWRVTAVAEGTDPPTDAWGHELNAVGKDERGAAILECHALALMHGDTPILFSDELDEIHVACAKEIALNLSPGAMCVLRIRVRFEPKSQRNPNSPWALSEIVDWVIDFSPRSNVLCTSDEWRADSVQGVFAHGALGMVDSRQRQSATVGPRFEVGTHVRVTSVHRRRTTRALCISSRQKDFDRHPIINSVDRWTSEEQTEILTAFKSGTFAETRFATDENRFPSPILDSKSDVGDERAESQSESDYGSESTDSDRTVEDFTTNVDDDVTPTAENPPKDVSFENSSPVDRAKSLSESSSVVSTTPSSKSTVPAGLSLRNSPELPAHFAQMEDVCARLTNLMKSDHTFIVELAKRDASLIATLFDIDRHVNQ